ncbi:MAG: hypothetical protein C0595_06750 [Marinilabiliales bacterium]|nr:MAG: hypothetical protein C0595_06750 [Marinilabiliales bacterium]
MTTINIENLNNHLEKFHKVFLNDDDCLEVLAELKWSDGFICSKCGNTNYCSGKSAFSRRCTKCKKEESATANTIFHRCKFSLKKAFEILLLACQAPVISSYKISEYLQLRHMTCYSFKKKIMDCRENTNDNKFIARLISQINTKISNTE